MDRRSTNVTGFVHFGGDVRSGAQAGIGFSLGSASTGSTAWIESVSDDTNANLGIRAQGAGTITIGTSSNKVALGGCTRAVKMQIYAVDIDPPAMAASTSALSSVTVTGLTTNSILVLTPRMPIQPSYSWIPRCSTANELIIQWINNSASTNSDSTNSGQLMVFSF
jgi:hypothetical protein